MHDNASSGAPDIPPSAPSPSPFAERWRGSATPVDIPRFRTRRDAGAALAQALGAYARRADLLVLAISPDSVPVASEVSRALSVPLDLFLASRLTAPSHDALAIGTVTTGGTIVLNRELVTRLRLPFALVRDAVARGRAEVERRERAYRGERARASVDGRTVLLIADAISTGATMRGVVAALRHAGAARVVCATPVAPPEIFAVMARAADDCLCLRTPKPYYGPGAWYEDYRPTPDAVVRSLLAERPSP